MIPDSERQATPPTALPRADATAGDLWIALDDQTARLDRANGRTADVVQIVEHCEAERARALKQTAGLLGWLKR